MAIAENMHVTASSQLGRMPAERRGGHVQILRKRLYGGHITARESPQYLETAMVRECRGGLENEDVQLGFRIAVIRIA